MPSAIRRLASVFALGLAFAALPLAAEGPDPSLGQSPDAKPLAIGEAVAAGLASDPGIRSGSFDLISARAKSMDALFRMLPSLTVSSGYTKLSDEPAMSTAGIPTSLVPLLALFSGAPTDSKDLRVDLQYPVFAGFRAREAAEIAKLAALGKEAALELTRRGFAFDIQRSYWEAQRAAANVASLAKGLELENVVKAEVRSMSEQGMATSADLLAEQARYDQTALALDEAKAGQALADLVLASLSGDASAAKDPGAIVYDLVTKPGSRPFADPGTDSAKLIQEALARRPETRAGSIALDVSRHAKVVAAGDLMPTLVLTGNVAYSNPDPRLFPVQDKFNLTWSAGARIRYDLGALPGATERIKAAEADMEKAGSDLERLRNAIALDVRKSVLVVQRARNSLEPTKGMVTQAEENLRVAKSRYDNGVAKRSELLQAQIALLRAQFAVENKTIDIEIAEADLLRAIAADSAF